MVASTSGLVGVMEGCVRGKARVLAHELWNRKVQGLPDAKVRPRTQYSRCCQFWQHYVLANHLSTPSRASTGLAHCRSRAACSPRGGHQAPDELRMGD